MYNRGGVYEVRTATVVCGVGTSKVLARESIAWSIASLCAFDSSVIPCKLNASWCMTAVLRTGTDPLTRKVL